MNSSSGHGVLLPENESGSAFLHRMLTGACRHFGDELGRAAPPADPRAFKRAYGDTLARFEAARLASPQRVAIARHLVEASHGALDLATEGRREPLREALEREAPRLEPVVVHERPSSGLRVEVPFEGRVWRDRAVLELVDRLHADHHLTDAARDGLRWIVAHIDAAGGALDLRGQRFAVLGAAAELSPAEALLAAGATVLWVDPKAPPPPAAGTLVYAPGANDILQEPRAVTEALRRFAEAGPVHVGLFAYAPGRSRELRLAGAMNAIVRSLGSAVVRSVALFISPTAPAELQPEDLRVVETRRAAPVAWQRALHAARVLPGPGYYGSDRAAVPRAVISLQGAAYQAAQYLAKSLTAEVLAVDGFGTDAALTVSANVAGITRTRSLEHPLFLAGFRGAANFGVRIFDPATTRALSGLLMLRDLLEPQAPTQGARQELERARAVHAAQIHGGVYDLPWQFEAAVRAAAVIGAVREPRLLLPRRR